MSGVAFLSRRLLSRGGRAGGVVERGRRVPVLDPEPLDRLRGRLARGRELLAHALAERRCERVDLADRRMCLADLHGAHATSSRRTTLCRLCAESVTGRRARSIAGRARARRQTPARRPGTGPPGAGLPPRRRRPARVAGRPDPARRIDRPALDNARALLDVERALQLDVEGSFIEAASGGAAPRAAHVRLPAHPPADAARRSSRPRGSPPRRSTRVIRLTLFLSYLPAAVLIGPDPGRAAPLAARARQPRRRRPTPS